MPLNVSICIYLSFGEVYRQRLHHMVGSSYKFQQEETSLLTVLKSKPPSSVPCVPQLDQSICLDGWILEAAAIVLSASGVARIVGEWMVTK